MLHLDCLDHVKAQAVRRIARRENFGVNEVDVQRDGTIFLNGYFCLRDLQALMQIAAEVKGDGAQVQAPPMQPSHAQQPSQLH